MSFSFVMVGEESLTQECAALLTARGHTLAAIVTDNQSLADWAAGKGAPVLSTGRMRGLAEVGPFDYLLSVVNLRMISHEILELPRVASINFHDGPLPRHAGLNAPVWALLAGDTSYGVTWHLMTAEPDRGHILEQERFTIDPEETAVSLNTRCFEAGIRSFERLAALLESGRVEGAPQDFATRTYHHRDDRPTLGGRLQFDLDAVEIVRTVRALDFGGYRNPIAVAKLLGPDGVVAVGAARPADTDAGAEPGTVLTADGEEIVIGVKGGAVALSGFRCLAGSPLSASEALKRTGLVVGAKAPALAREFRDAIEGLVRRSAGYEPKAVEVLEHAPFPELPLLRPAPGASAGMQSLRSSVCVTDGARLVAAFGRSLSLLAGRDVRFDLVAPSTVPVPAAAALLFTEVIPVAIPASSGDPVKIANRAISAGPISSDIAARNIRTAPGGDSVALVIDRPVPVGHKASLVLRVDSASGETAWSYDSERFSRDDLAALDAILSHQLSLLDGGTPGEGPFVSEGSANQLRTFNETHQSFSTTSTIAEAFEAAVERHPQRVAVTGGGVEYTYAQLNSRANALAARLRHLGVQPDALVAVHLERSVDIVTALLGIHKAGGAYVPVDPSYPEARKRLMIEDSRASIVVTSAALAREVSAAGLRILILEQELAAAPAAPNLQSLATGDSLAYVIYTSGSTGRPKGVMVEHRNVLNFFAGMDERIGTDPGVWLAVTSISFDISVLELLWTVTRGFTVVIDAAKPTGAPARPSFSLFFFSSEGGTGQGAYDLVLRASKFADERGFEAVWTPERHFHSFGGAFPNPSVMSAAIASCTSRVQIRSGSCVLPLHSPIRVAEEWSVVDNISNGRVGVSFAAGWQPDDFVLRPESFGQARDVMEREIPVVQALWRGESQAFPGPQGREVQVRTLPRPVQRELPTWITSAGDPETFRLAGRMGANILTHLLGQSVEAVAERIKVYREAWDAAGHPGSGQVTMMLHTFIGADDDEVKDIVREPMIGYLGSSVGLIKQFASTFPAFKNLPQGDDPNELLASLSKSEMRELLEVAFERYYETSGLFGTPARAAEMVARLKEAGVDEVACLVDFGVPSQQVFEGLERLAEFKDALGGSPESGDERLSAGDLIRKHRVTHLQCTPSMASMFVADPETRSAFASLEVLMVGGEALPGDLATSLVNVTGGRVLNMYGPTETTIWSTTSPVTGADPACPIGTPIANTSIYILDAEQRLLPPGMVGELWIGGEGVTRGYLERPELTAERFLPDPFGHATGGRMYRTGDLARIRPDGVVDFLGRVDQQVKVRGYRIEPGEIESVMRSLPGIVEAVVIAREDEPGDHRLVGYYVSATGEDGDTGSLRAALGAQLPEYMVPTNFVRLDRLPLTPNAKIDRKALPAPSAKTAPLASRKAAPETPPVEPNHVDASPEAVNLVASTWEQVLRAEALPRDRSFFDLGGNSLLLLQVHRRLHEHHPDLRLTELFKYPTISSLALHLSHNRPSTTQRDDGMSRASARRAALGRRLTNA